MEMSKLLIIHKLNDVYPEYYLGNILDNNLNEILEPNKQTTFG